MVRVSRAWVRDFGGNPQIYNLLPSHFSGNRRRFECGHTGLEGLTVPSVVSVSPVSDEKFGGPIEDSGSHMTHCRRKRDSNPRSPERQARSKPAR